MTSTVGSAPGIWRWSGIFEPAVPSVHRVTLGEGDTPLVGLPSLAARLGVASLWVKRDDLSPAGSHKSRSLAYRISLARARGEQTVLLSSSGNAAAAASAYCAAAGVRLIAFVSPETPPVKLGSLSRDGTTVVACRKPRNLARYAARVFGIPNLTPSLDDLSIEGFKTIACELRETDATDFFTFVTSGSSFVGVARAASTLEWKARLHAVQAGAAGHLAGAADPRFASRALPPSRLAGLLGIDESPRAEAVRADMCRGWVQDDDEILAAHAWLRDGGIDTSAEGAACLSAVARARTEGTLDSSAHVVVLLTGHACQWPTVAADLATVEVESYLDLRNILMERFHLLPREKA